MDYCSLRTPLWPILFKFRLDIIGILVTWFFLLLYSDILAAYDSILTSSSKCKIYMSRRTSRGLLQPLYATVANFIQFNPE